MATVLTALRLADPAGDPADAPVAAQRGHDMTAQRRGRAVDSIGVSLLSAVLLLWSLLPIYNIIRVPCRKRRKCSAPPSTDRAQPACLRRRFHQCRLAAETFWNQMGKQFLHRVGVALLTLTIGSLTSFPSAGCAFAAAGC